jgi:hypothetical protein
MGSIIEPSEHFYFRHDSNLNDGYLKAMKTFSDKQNKNILPALENHVNNEWMSKVLYKMKNAWKTLKQGFRAINSSG